jgi:hypothetical protein
MYLGTSVSGSTLTLLPATNRTSVFLFMVFTKKKIITTKILNVTDGPPSFESFERF